MGVILRRAWKALAYWHLDLKGVACEGLVCKGVASGRDLACKGMAKEGKHAQCVASVNSTNRNTGALALFYKKSYLF